MGRQAPDFYLASSEGYGMEEPRRCFRLRRLRGDGRDDYLLVMIDPPLIGQHYGLAGRDIDMVVLATRFLGDSLFPITRWPVFVHVARALVADVANRDILHAAQMEEIGWAELYAGEQAAREKRM